MISLFALIGEKGSHYNGVPAINIDNGSDVDAVPQRSPKFDGKIHLLAVAAMSTWHGYDRLINGIAALTKEDRENVIFDMVGDEGDGSLNEWRRMTKELGLEKQIFFHGKKVGAELNSFYEIADIGICSLGMYRIHFDCGSILKLREYTARGLPFIYAANDPALPSAQSFCMKVPNDDTPIDIKKVVDFAMSLRLKQAVPEEMRNYARVNMSWVKQMDLVLQTVQNM